MTNQAHDPYLEALREDLPSAGDEARLRHKLLGAGLGLSVAFASTTVAASTPLLKASIVSSLASRFMNLSLVSQFSVVTAATTVAITAPVWVAAQKTPAVESAAQNVAASRAHRVMPSEPAPRVLPTLAVAQGAPSPTAGASESKMKALPRAQTGAHEAEAAKEVSTLAEETRLLDTALSSIRAGELPRAAGLLDEHEARFARGKLGRERQRAREKLDEAYRRSGQ